MNILVMGDSYSAGNGAGGYEGQKGCYRSSENYGERFAKQLTPSANVRTVACSGATTANFTNPQVPQNNPSNGTIPRQLSHIKKSDDLIFLTVGGNDAGFSDIAANCLVSGVYSPWGWDSKKCDKALTKAENLLAEPQPPQTFVPSKFEAKITKVLQGIRSKASPTAKIVLVGYPHLERDRTPPITLPGPDSNKPWKDRVQVGTRVRALAANADRIDAELVRKLGSGFAYVSTIERFKDHELRALAVSTPDRWFVQPGETKSYETWYHPNPVGWAQITDLLLSNSDVPKEATPPAPTAPAIHSITASASDGIVTFRIHASSPNPFTPYTGAPREGWATVGLWFSCLTPEGERAGNYSTIYATDHLVSGTTSDGVFEHVADVRNFRPSACKIYAASVTTDYYGTWVTYGNEAVDAYDNTEDPFPGAHFTLPN